jgi:hypothetical protein
VQVVKQAGTGEVDVPITFSTTGFTGMPAGDCGSVSNSCGHVHLYIDPDSMDNSPCTPTGSPYNNASPLAEADGGATPFSPINAIMSSCGASDAIDGMHTVVIELHSDNHAAIVGANGKTISASVTFTAAGD